MDKNIHVLFFLATNENAKYKVKAALKEGRKVDKQVALEATAYAYYLYLDENNPAWFDRTTTPTGVSLNDEDIDWDYIHNSLVEEYRNEGKNE